MKNLSIKKIKKTIICILFVFTVVFIPVSVQGKTDTMSNSKGAMKVQTDGSYITISYEGVWDYNISETINVSVNGSPVNGALGQLVINSGNNVDSQTIVVRDGWWSALNSATGYAENSGYANGRYEKVFWSIKVPVSVYGNNVSDMSFGWSNQSVDILLNPVEAETTETTEVTEATETTEATEATEATETTETTETATTEAATTVNPDLEVTSKLVIDGYYSDWVKYPVTKITYTSNNTNSIHIGQIYSDGDNVYVHFAMNDLYTSQMQVQQMTITINGESHSIGIYPVRSDGSIDWDAYNKMFNLPNGIHKNLGMIVDYTKYCDSKAAITIYDQNHSDSTKGDELEFMFSLSDFEKITGLKLDGAAQITIKNPNIGSEGVTWVGTSSGPWIGVIAAACLACAGAGIYAGKRKRKGK